jgi:hypothetical protein
LNPKEIYHKTTPYYLNGIAINLDYGYMTLSLCSSVSFLSMSKLHYSLHYSIMIFLGSARKGAEGDLLSPASFSNHLIYSSHCNILTVANKYIRDQKYSAIRQT